MASKVSPRFFSIRASSSIPSIRVRPGRRAFAFAGFAGNRFKLPVGKVRALRRAIVAFENPIDDEVRMRRTAT